MHFVVVRLSGFPLSGNFRKTLEFENIQYTFIFFAMPEKVSHLESGLEKKSLCMLHSLQSLRHRPDQGVGAERDRAKEKNGNGRGGGERICVSLCVRAYM